MKKCKAVAAAAIVAAASLTGPFSTVGAADSYDMNITVDLGAETKEISPYIYGINQYGN